LPFTAYRATVIHPNDPFTLAGVSSFGMAAVLLPLRPSSEDILIVRGPGASDQHWCHFTPFMVGALRARRASGHSFPTLLRRAFRVQEDNQVAHPTQSGLWSQTEHGERPSFKIILKPAFQ